MKDAYVSTEHVLMGLTANKTWLGDTLKRHGITRDAVFQVLKDIRGSQRAEDPNAEEKYQAFAEPSPPTWTLSGTGRSPK